jgi:type II secretory pathway pseudopilin PulG
MFKRTSARVWSSTHGFSLVEQLFTLGLVATIAGVAVPALTNGIEAQRLGIEARNIEREIQLARLAAVSTNRPIRLRFNCPDIGYYRRVELIGSVNNPTTGDDADNQGARRCNTLVYPYPAADLDPLTRPNNDGPLLRLNSKVTFTSTQTLEFWPNGTVHTASIVVGQPWPQVGSTPVNIVLTKGSTTRLVSVNTLGKTQIQ